MRVLLLLLLALPLAGCSDANKEDNKVTQTIMDDIDSIEGTINDDMIDTDQSTEQAPLEAAPVADTATKNDTKSAETKKTQTPPAVEPQTTEAKPM